MEFKFQWHRICALLLVTILVFNVLGVPSAVFSASTPGNNPPNVDTPGSLTVTKTVTGLLTTKKWHFKVTLSGSADYAKNTSVSWDKVQGQFGEMHFNSGVAEFDLGNGDSITASELPAGLGYKVEETADTNFTSSFAGSTDLSEGTIPANGNAAVTCTNTFTGNKGDLSVQKIVEGETSGKATYFEFTVTLGDTTIQGIYGDMTFAAGVATFRLEGGRKVTATGLPVGVSYNVTETDADKNGYKTTWSNQSGEIGSSTTEVVCTNTYEASGVLVVSKTVAGEGADETKTWHFRVELSDKSVTGEHGDMTFNNGVAEFTLKHGGSAKATELPADVTYTVTETEADQDDYTTSSSGASGTITDGGTAEAKFTNTKNKVTPKTGSLTVSKTVVGEGADETKVWHFRVELSDKSVTGEYGDMTFTDGVAEPALKHGESATAAGLPAGVTYTVTETEADQDDYATSSTGASGTITDGGTAEAKFTNTKNKVIPKTGSLTVSKTVAGEGADETKVWHFRVELSDKSVTGEYGDMTFADGVAELELKHGELSKATELPAGVTYTVTETEANQDDYTTSSTGESGTIPEGDTAKAEFTNTKKDEAPKTGSLSVTKTVTGSAGDTNKAWTFTVTLSDTTINDTYGDMTFADGIATFTLKHGETATASGLPAGITYTVAETEANADGYKTTATGATGAIPENDTATAAFTNDLPTPSEPKTGSLTVTKTVTGNGDTTKAWHFTVTLSDTTLNGTYGDMTFTDGVATFALKHGESKTAEGLPTGITYTVTETEANEDGYTTTSEGTTGEITDGVTAKASFTNTKPEPEVGSLTVSKTVAGTEGDTNKDWNFTVTLSDTTINGTYGGMTFADGVATFTLKHGESKTATGLPAGITYTVIEAEADQDGYGSSAVSASGFIPKDSVAEAKFTNTKPEPEEEKGNLTVTKTVSGTEGDTAKDWNFTVTLDDTTINGSYGDMTFTNGVATFTLKHGESKTATGLPAGITYTVTETEANADGYTTTATGDTGTIPENDTAKAAFTNDLPTPPEEPNTGSLIVTKTVTGDGDTTKEWHFTVTLSDTTINGAYGDMTFTNGVAEFTLRHGDRLSATDLPKDITYTVRETEADQNGYETTASGATGTIPAGNTAMAEFVNDIPEPERGGLTVTKVVTGEGSTSKDWNFTVTLSDTTINGTYGGMTFTNGIATFTLKHGESRTATGLPAGVTYSVTEAEANLGGYSTSADGASGNIPEGGTAVARFTNDKPRTRPHKIENSPGEGQPVQVGQEISYTISWENYKDESATVIVRDHLDSGVDFVSAPGGSYDAAMHTVTWNLGTQPAGAQGAVTLTVKVNASAMSKPNVSNAAEVTVDNVTESTVETPTNPTEPGGDPHKEEIRPGTGETVKVGDEITYVIDWTNWTADTAAVTITDPLNPGVDFVSASNGGSYDAGSHTVTWHLGDQAVGAIGSVTLTVKVNDRAAESTDKTIYNMATVTVGTESKDTEIPENPVEPEEPGGEPHKTEVTPGDGETVKVGDEITYVIDWINWTAETNEVTITDPLDDGVDFVSASDGGTYDSAIHTVTWKLGEKASEETGYVTLVVKVNATALTHEDLTVYNRGATVTVGNETKPLEVPENPVEPEEPGGEPHKTETTPGDGETVQVGDEITYVIDWVNWTADTAAVTITDPLDVGVDFVSATDGGTYDMNTRTVTWSLGEKASGASGSVTLVVKVNANAPAKEDKTVYNQATVTIGDESKQTEIPKNPLEEAGNLTVTKILEGKNADSNKNWTFTVTLSDTTIKLR